jgi:hypothetical protein
MMIMEMNMVNFDFLQLFHLISNFYLIIGNHKCIFRPSSMVDMFVYLNEQEVCLIYKLLS